MQKSLDILVFYFVHTIIIIDIILYGTLALYL